MINYTASRTLILFKVYGSMATPGSHVKKRYLWCTRHDHRRMRGFCSIAQNVEI